jgi:hypothetical protein
MFAANMAGMRKSDRASPRGRLGDTPPWICLKMAGEHWNFDLNMRNDHLGKAYQPNGRFLAACCHVTLRSLKLIDR